jgi:hypothetical protein
MLTPTVICRHQIKISEKDAGRVRRNYIVSNFQMLIPFYFVKVCEVFARAKEKSVSRWVEYPIWLGYYVTVNDWWMALTAIRISFTLRRLLQWLYRGRHNCVVAGWTSLFGWLRLMFVGIYFTHADATSRLQTASNEGITLSFNRVMFLFLVAWGLTLSWDWEFATQALSADLSCRINRYKLLKK